MSAMDFQQTQIQSQLQVMSQKQIQSLELLSLASVDLREAVYKAAAENPALVITKDSLALGQKNSSSSKRTNDFTRTTSRTTAAGREASDNFQAALESKADERQSLSEHLLMQFHLLQLNSSEEALGEKLIHNLDEKGCHILAPVSLLDKNDALQNDEMLSRLLKQIQSLDPVGICVRNTEESLFVQAKNKFSAKDTSNKDTDYSARKGALSSEQKVQNAVLFILDGHLSFLDPPQPAKVLKKISSFLEDAKNFPESEATKNALSAESFDEETISLAIDFIRTLDPFPARDFGTSNTHYVVPDIYVEKIPVEVKDDDLKEDFAKGIIVQENCAWNIRLSRETMPELQLSKDFESLLENKSAINVSKTEAVSEQADSSSRKSISSKDQKLISSSLKKAQDFIDMISFRQSTIQKACCFIVKKQHDFFAKGPGHLVPMKQADIAEEVGVHETTISRMANGKYIQCDWGLFEIKYFFTNAASAKEADSPDAVSKEKVLFTIKAILEEHKDDKKKLSDQKLCDILSERGISIARRTVAKYRSQLNIESSFKRQ